MRPQVVIAVIVLLVTVLAGVARGGFSSTPDPKALVLQLPDMPTGFGLKSGQYWSNAAAARESKEPLSRFVGWGRINGYEADYTKPVALSALLKGPIEIDSTVSVYSAAAGARASFADSLARGSKHPEFKQLSVGTSLGDQARLYTYAPKSGGLTVHAFVVVWRADRFVAEVITAGVEGGIASESAVDLAKRVQVRLKRAA